MSNTIEGNPVYLKPKYGFSDITLLNYNDDENYKIKFGSNVIFSKGSKFETVQLGDWKIELDGENFVIKKNDNILFQIRE